MPLPRSKASFWPSATADCAEAGVVEAPRRIVKAASATNKAGLQGKAVKASFRSGSCAGKYSAEKHNRDVLTIKTMQAAKWS